MTESTAPTTFFREIDRNRRNSWLLVGVVIVVLGLLFSALGVLSDTTWALVAGTLGERLRRISFDEVVREYAIYGAPESVTDRLLDLREAIGASKLCVWMNVGSRVPHDRILASMRRFAESVLPRLA